MYMQLVALAGVVELEDGTLGTVLNTGLHPEVLNPIWPSFGRQVGWGG